MSNANAELVAAGDIDELTRYVGRLADAGDWDGLVDLRDRCRAALARGHQLWGVASWCEYRLALDAPGQWAATVLVADAGRFAIGPLPEVAASTHTWNELAPWAPTGPAAAIAAHERIARGDDLTGDDRVLAGVLELPLALASWEPAYPAATYKADGAEFGDVPSPRLEPLVLRGAAPAADDPDACAALLDLAGPWVAASGGVARAVAVEGDAAGAIAAVADAATVRAAPVDAAHALAYLAWTAASGGAHGRRRGLAAGRFAAWWTAAALTGLLDTWPPDPGELGDAIAELRWWRWDDRALATGWWLGLAIDDPAEGLAWAVRAADHRES